MKLLPRPLTRFIGRKNEIERIVRQLSDPDCRLLTLVGVGGTGKTRLAIETADTYADLLSCDVHFVNLQATQDVAQLPSAIADSLGLTLSGADPLSFQLHQHLSTKNGLIVLDNFEQLLVNGAQAQAVQFISSLLSKAEQIKLLITSREPLEIVEEWLYPVNGLTHSAENATQSDAATLFVRSARRVRPQFDADTHANAIAQLCTIVDGMPLAIELAAAWTKSLSVAEIVEELNQSTELLATNLHNLPPRHRSIETVIDQTWSRLNEREQAAFGKLSVFRGGFQREAAKEIAGASIPLLTALLDKSLLRWEQDKRYQVHELLRQYAAQKLGDDGAVTHAKHAHFYAALAAKLQARLIAVDHEAHDVLRADLDNFRAAWRWACQHRAIDELFSLAVALATFLGMRNLNMDYVETFEMAARQLLPLAQDRNAARVRAYLLCCLGKAYVRLGQINAADDVLLESKAIYETLDVPHAPGLATDPTIFLSIVSYMRSDFEQGIARAEQALAVAQAQGHQRNMAYAYNMMSGSQYVLNRFDDAERSARASLEIVQRLGARDHLAFAHIELSKIESGRGELALAENHIRAAIQVRRETRQINGEAMALNALARCQVSQNQLDVAKKTYEQALKLHGQAKDIMGVQSCMSGLAEISASQGKLIEARQHYLTALDIGLAQNLVTYSGTTLLGISKLLLGGGHTERGNWLLLSLANIPTLSANLHARVSAAIDEKAVITAPLGTDVMQLMELMRRELPDFALADHSETAQQDGPDQSGLIEQLTPRELEILQGICLGKTNRTIAEELFLSIGTVKWYSQQIYGKLAVKNRTQAMLRAQELELV